MTVSPLDEKLNFDDHIQSKISKWNKFIGIIKRLSRAFPSDAFITIYKSFIRPHLDYADIIYDKPNNDSISQKIENAQYRGNNWDYSRKLQKKVLSKIRTWII